MSNGSGERLLESDLSARTFDPRATDDPPARARAVVVGGGIIGASTAFHLAECGWRDVVLLERDRLSCGTSWHAAGLVTRTRATHMQTDLARYSGDFYKKLSELSGIDVGYYENGALSLAQTSERLIEIRYSMTLARHHGLPAEQLTPAEVHTAWPLIEVGDLVGGVYFEGDATVNPGIAAYATAKAAFDRGVRIVERCSVTGFRLSGARIVGVETDRGPVECEVAVLAAGLWTRDLALRSGTRVALHAAEHMWVRTQPMPGVQRELPILRDLDGRYYIRHYRGGLLVGAFEPEGKPRATSSIPADFSFGEFGPDWPHFEQPLSKARRRMPALNDARLAHFLNAPEGFTPDVNFLMGETAEVAGLYVAAGLNSQGIIFGPGIGRALASWIDAGAPTTDVSEVDVRRFAPAQANAAYLFERTRESLGRLYAMHWPFLQPQTARGLRRIPLHERLAKAGACFGETAGWERANWFAPPEMEPVYEYSYGRQNWFEVVGEEHRAARKSVALLDLSSFAKFLVQGRDALHAVQRIFPSDLDRAPGSVVYTCLLNSRGGIEVDLTVTRRDEQSFFIVAPAATQTKVYHWLRQHLREEACVTDVTSGLGVLGVMGPRSRELLSRLTSAALDDVAFPFASAREIDIGWATALALRVSFTGELGWELHVPVESLVGLYDRLLEAGGEFGLRLAGLHALDALRTEKGFRHWGADMGPADTPYEAGLGFTVSPEKVVEFIGQAALKEQMSMPLSRRLLHLRLDDPEALLYHGESVLAGGRLVGRVTSGAFGYTLGASVGLAYIQGSPDELDAMLASGAVEVEIAGARVPGTLSERSYYDPKGERMRGGPAKGDTPAVTPG